MRIVNKTRYRTDDLRRWLNAAHKAMAAPTHKTVEVKYSHRGMAWGCASFSGGWMMLTLPGDPDKVGGVGRLAQLLEHEIAHNLGLRHGEMHPSTRRGAAREPGSWEEGMELPRLREEPSKPSPEDRVAQREAKARKMLERWERKVKLAKTRLAKWAAKVRYYERRAAERK